MAIKILKQNQNLNQLKDEGARATSAEATKTRNSKIILPSNV